MSYSPIRKIVINLNKRLAKEISSLPHRQKILEIGCGSWSYLQENGMNLEWHGIDVKKTTQYGNQTLATKIGSVEKIPYNSNTFDFVLCNQSIEHWYEYGVTFAKGLSEIHRVLKNGGIMQANVPIHLHGHKHFVLGNLNKIRKNFDSKSWVLRTEKWKNTHHYQGWKLNNIPKFMVAGRSSYVFNIIASKKNWRPKPKEMHYRIVKLYSVIPLKIRKAIHYGPRFIINRLLK